MSTQSFSKKVLGLAVFSALFSITLALLSEVFIKKFIDSWLPEDSGLTRFVVVAILLFLLFVLFVALVTSKVGKIVGVNVSAIGADRQDALPFLVMGYSPNDCALEVLLNELERFGPEAVAENSENYENLYTGSEQPLRNIWQQNLRSAWFHNRNNELKVIFVLNPSVDQFDKFHKYMDTALNEHNGYRNSDDAVEIVRINHPRDESKPFTILNGSGRDENPDYENYDYVYAGLSQGLLQVRERRTLLQTYIPTKDFPNPFFSVEVDLLADEKTCIDITAGQKVFSIAAAALTLNRPLKFSYVTNYGELRFFDTNLEIAGQALS